MKITAIKTNCLGEFPNLIWFRVYTDQGLAGLGEIFFGAPAVAAHLHDAAAPQLLGENPLAGSLETAAVSQTNVRGSPEPGNALSNSLS